MPEETPSTEASTKSTQYPTLDIVERLAKIFSIVAIPIVIPIALAIYTAKLQQSSQVETINRDYVQLAVSLLKEKTDVDPGIRDWAVDLLAEHSPTKFKPDVIAALKSGAVALPNLSIVPTALQALSPDSKLLAKSSGLRIHVLDTGTQQIKMVFDSDNWITAMDFSGDSAYLAAGHQDGTATLYKLDDGEKIQTLTTDSPVVELRFDPLGQIQIRSTRGIWIYNVTTGQLVRKILPGPPPVLRKVTPS